MSRTFFSGVRSALGGDEQLPRAAAACRCRRRRRARRRAGALRAIDVGELLRRDGVELRGGLGGRELERRLGVRDRAPARRAATARRASEDCAGVDGAAGRLDQAVVEQRDRLVGRDLRLACPSRWRRAPAGRRMSFDAFLARQLGGEAGAGRIAGDGRAVAGDQRRLRLSGLGSCAGRAAASRRCAALSCAPSPISLRAASVATTRRRRPASWRAPARPPRAGPSGRASPAAAPGTAGRPAPPSGGVTSEVMRRSHSCMQRRRARRDLDLGDQALERRRRRARATARRASPSRRPPSPA